MRYISAQLDALLGGDLWERAADARQRDGAAARRRGAGHRRRAGHAARRGQRGVRRCSTRRLPSELQRDVAVLRLGRGHRRGALDGARGTRAEEDVDAFAADVRAVVSRSATAAPVTSISGPVGVQVDQQPAGPPEVLALEDRHRRRRLDEAQLAQVGAERGSRRAGRGILDDAARRERVARVEARRRPRATRAGSWSSRARPSARRGGRSRSRGRRAARAWRRRGPGGKRRRSRRAAAASGSRSSRAPAQRRQELLEVGGRRRSPRAAARSSAWRSGGPGHRAAW